ncbi:MAG: methyltransferase domain-containing protein [Defluviitaleaceae bacterium]|nr:methyltransferase domain-containing protein [Defluviitaleaceae bacterium]
MGRLSFLLQYVTKPRTVGAVMPSSKYLARKMVEGIDFAAVQAIAEFGPGTGVLTREILLRRNPSTLLLLFERNENFCRELQEKFGSEPNLHIINDSAENIAEHLAAHGFSHVDCVVSGLPFASLPRQVAENILVNTVNLLKPGGKFITFQYSLFKKDFIGRFFNKINIQHEIRNIPPAYVLECSN